MNSERNIITKEEKEQIIEKNMGLVYQVVKRFEGRGVERDDLIQIGSMGLVKAVNHFEEERGFQLSTYAVPLIIGEIKRYFRDSQTVHFSRHLKELAFSVNKAKEEMVNRLGREPTLEELEEKLKVSKEDLIACLDVSKQVKSLEEPIDANEEGCALLLHTLADERQLEEEVITRMIINNAMENLSLKEQNVIRLRFYYGKNQSEIARLISLSQAQVSRIEKGALQTLFSHLQDTLD